MTYLGARVFLAAYQRMFSAPLPLDEITSNLYHPLQNLAKALEDKPLREIDIMSRESMLDLLETVREAPWK